MAEFAANIRICKALTSFQHKQFIQLANHDDFIRIVLKNNNVLSTG